MTEDIKFRHLSIHEHDAAANIGRLIVNLPPLATADKATRHEKIPESSYLGFVKPKSSSLPFVRPHVAHWMMPSRPPPCYNAPPLAISIYP